MVKKDEGRKRGGRGCLTVCLVLLVCCLCSYSCSSRGQIKCWTPGNLGYVGDGVWRSGQSWFNFAQWEFVKPKTIINLASDPENDPQDLYEIAWCLRKQIILWQFKTISPDYGFEEAYFLLKEAERPIIVHCEAGKDRTGGLIAVYKREVLRSTFTDIIDDWYIYGLPSERWLFFLFNRFD